MPKFRKGQQLRAEFECEAASDSNGYGVFVRIGHGTAFFLPHATVTAIAPLGWPPEVGDVWEAEGTEYVCLATNTMAICMRITTTRGGGGRVFFPQKELETEFRPLNPVLLRRREEKEDG